MRQQSIRGPCIDERGADGSATFQRHSPGGNGVHDTRIQKMLDPQHPYRQSPRVVAAEHGHRPLRDDASPIVLLVDEMCCDARDTRSRFDHSMMNALTVHAGTTKRRKQRWMYVQDPAMVLRDYLARNELEVARQNEKVD